MDTHHTAPPMPATSGALGWRSHQFQLRDGLGIPRSTAHDGGGVVSPRPNHVPLTMAAPAVDNSKSRFLPSALRAHLVASLRQQTGHHFRAHGADLLKLIHGSTDKGDGFEQSQECFAGDRRVQR